jgi:hypothetical protein
VGVGGERGTIVTDQAPIAGSGLGMRFEGLARLTPAAAGVGVGD